MTLEGDLLGEINALASEYEERRRVLNSREVVEVDKLKGKFGTVLTMLSSEYSDIRTLEGELATVKAAPAQLARLRNEHKMLKEKVSQEARSLFWKRAGHGIRIAATPLVLLGIPAGIAWGGWELTEYMWEQGFPAKLWSILTGAATFIGPPVSFIGLAKAIGRYCDSSTYNQDVSKLKEKLVPLNNDLKSLESKIKIETRRIEQDTSVPLQREITGLKMKRDRKEKTIRQMFGVKYSNMKETYKWQREELKVGYMTSRAPLVERLEELGSQLPELALTAPDKPFIKNKYSRVRFKFSNHGSGVARNVRLYFEGQYDGKKEARFAEINPGDSESVLIAIKPLEYGDMEWGVRIEYEDVLGRKHSDLQSYWVYAAAKDGQIISNAELLLQTVFAKKKAELEDANKYSMVPAKTGIRKA